MADYLKNIKGVMLETKNLVKDFGGLRAIDNVNFKLYRGEFHAIIGPNGAGKTTFLNLITGKLRPTSGKIFFLGDEITGLHPHTVAKKGVALSLQLTKIFPNLTVFENIWVGAQSNYKLKNPFIRAWSLAEIHQKVNEICKIVGLHNKIDEIASNLSHGDQKLLDIAIALSTNPQLLLLDEPLAGLSRKEFAHIIDVIKDLARTTTIILVEHNIDAVMKLAKQITVFDHGKIIAEGSPYEISQNEKVQEIYLGRRR